MDVPHVHTSKTMTGIPTKGPAVERLEQSESNGKATWKNAQNVATEFFAWLYDPQRIIFFAGDLHSVEREKVHELFVMYAQVSLASSFQRQKRKQKLRLESLVMAALNRQKRLKTKRYSDGVIICSFARSDGTFAPYQDRVTARDKLKQKRAELQANKAGVVVAEQPIVTPENSETGLLPTHSNIDIQFFILAEEKSAVLKSVKMTPSNKKHFQLQTQLPIEIAPGKDPVPLCLTLQTKGTAVYRVNVLMEFAVEGTDSSSTLILRTLALKATADQAMMQMLQPISPYQRKKKNSKADFPVPINKILSPPPKPVTSGTSGGRAAGSYNRLQGFKIPVDIQEMMKSSCKEDIEATLEVPTHEMPEEQLAAAYPIFWQQLLWLSELQTYEDIKLFDMEDASLERHGRLFKLTVPGLAEGRPSVLRGDMVHCHWKNKQYRGRVDSVQLLDLLLEFHPSFHRNFNVDIDRVDVVRFTFSRTSFRTSHQGCLGAPEAMKPTMLMPQPIHIQCIQQENRQRPTRLVPNHFAWASQLLNSEQKQAVMEIAKATLRPMPYIIFGPPGTGKTSTLVEAVYQLARLHQYNRTQKKLKILLVAPSNDATDLLVEKLSSYFPPSDMLRVLAYTRDMKDVPATVKPYCKEGLDGEHLIQAILPVQLVVCTVNLAARFTHVGDGVAKGTFDVVCVDEAGHATEPEVIGVVASLMSFHCKDPGQLILAGDPNQLGPVITSEICQKFGMGVSYMERLIRNSPAYNNSSLTAVSEQDTEQAASPKYPRDLVAMLVRNYRSHPAILKLPNEMFYDNSLMACGDPFATHTMLKWEHLPTHDNFPIVFHSIDGENLREGTSPSWFNPQEVVTVIEYVDLLVNQSRPAVSPNDIGIITPYARQVQKIRLALGSKNLSGIKVGSVETFQGQERRCIIISTVRSELSLLSHDQKYNLGFVANAKRFNVAITRAKALLIVVGNPLVLATDKKNWLPFLRFCRDHKGWNGDEWKEDEAEEEPIAGDVSDIDDGGDREWEVIPDSIPHGFINREE